MSTDEWFDKYDSCCSNPCIIYDGEVKCASCGTTFGRQLVGLIDRAYDSIDKKLLSNNEPLNFTTIGDSRGFEIDDCRQFHKNDSGLLYRINKLARQVRNGIIRDLGKSASLMIDYCSRLGLPDYVKHNASLILSVAKTTKSTKGYNAELFACGVILYSSRLQDSDQRTLDMILSKCVPSDEEIMRYNRRTVTRVFKLIHDDLKGLLEKKYANYNWKTKPVKPVNLVPYLVSALYSSEEVSKLSIRIINDFVSYSKPKGNSPVVIAAGAVYLAGLISGEKRSQKSVAEISLVTDVALRSVYKKICIDCPKYKQYIK